MTEEVDMENNDIPLEPKEPIELNLMAVIGFNGGVIDGLILHPDNETIIFPLGSIFESIIESELILESMLMIILVFLS